MNHFERAKADNIISDNEGAPIVCPCCSESYDAESHNLVEAYEMISEYKVCPECVGEKL